MGQYKITCNDGECNNYIIGAEPFQELADKHGWKQTGGIKNCYVCPLHVSSKPKIKKDKIIETTESENK